MTKSETFMIPNHKAAKLSELDMMIVNSVPPGGNWKNIPLDVPSKRITNSSSGIVFTGKRITAVNKDDKQSKKTDYVGDSSNVINIVSGQEYPAGYSYDSIEIQSETEPYGLTVFLKDEPSAAKLEDELQVNADMTFDLIGNLGTIDYKTADSKEIIASYER